MTQLEQWQQEGYLYSVKVGVKLSFLDFLLQFDTFVHQYRTCNIILESVSPTSGMVDVLKFSELTV